MTPTQRAAAEQALECLESLQGGCTDSNDGTVEALTVWCPEVIDALRAALAEPMRCPEDGGACGAGGYCRPEPPPERADVAAVMASVWALVRSGPNFDGRQVDVKRAVVAAIDATVAAERDRWQSQCAGKRHDGCAYLAICGSVCNKCGRVA